MSWVRKLTTYILLVVVTFQLFFQSFAIALTLQGRWDLEKIDPMAGLDSTTQEVLRKRHVLFVSGLTNEMNLIFPYYYTDSIEVVEKQLGMSSTYFGPPSRASVSDNSKALYNEIVKNFSNYEKPLILICHSKGAAECLYTVLEYPELIFNGLIDRIVLIQAALKGSPLVSWEWYNFQIKMVSLLLGDGFKSLEPKKISNEFNLAFKYFNDYLSSIWSKLGEKVLQEQYQNFSKKIYYVRSVARKEDYGLALKLVLFPCWYGIRPPNESDGLLLVKDQMFDSIGIDLGVLKADHAGLTIGGIFSRTSDPDRKAFTRAILAQIYLNPY